jgi:plastocyanin
MGESVMNRLRSAILVLALGVAASAQAGAEEVVVIEMFQYQFVPEQVTIKPGTTVRWVNKEKRQFHNVWFREAGEEPGEYLFPEDQYERVFDQAGDYPYVCQPHQDRMRGRILVVE